MIWSIVESYYGPERKERYMLQTGLLVRENRN